MTRQHVKWGKPGRPSVGEPRLLEAEGRCCPSCGAQGVTMRTKRVKGYRRVDLRCKVCQCAWWCCENRRETVSC